MHWEINSPKQIHDVQYNVHVTSYLHTIEIIAFNDAIENSLK